MGITRPPPFLAAWSRNSITLPIRPFGSVTMSQVRLAISPARMPALVDSNTITRLRDEFRRQPAYTRRSRTSADESIFACLPGIREATLITKQAYANNVFAAMKTEIALCALTDKEIVVFLSVIAATFPAATSARCGRQRIIVWLVVRVLSAPPRSLSNRRISRRRPKSPQLAGCCGCVSVSTETVSGLNLILGGLSLGRGIPFPRCRSIFKN